MHRAAWKGVWILEPTIDIRRASPGDAEALLALYAPYVTDTAVTFEYEVPSLDTFRHRVERTLKKYPYIVAERNGEIFGYAYTGAFAARPAYGWSAETTIYIQERKRKMGIGRKLYQALEGLSKAQNILNLYARIAIPDAEDEFLTWDSARFHTHMGYGAIGAFHHCGYKFGRWYNLLCMEKLLLEHPEDPAAVIDFPDIGAEVLAALGVQ